MLQSAMFSVSGSFSHFYTNTANVWASALSSAQRIFQQTGCGAQGHFLNCLTVVTLRGVLDICLNQFIVITTMQQKTTEKHTEKMFPAFHFGFCIKTYKTSVVTCRWRRQETSLVPRGYWLCMENLETNTEFAHLPTLLSNAPVMQRGMREEPARRDNLIFLMSKNGFAAAASLAFRCSVGGLIMPLHITIKAWWMYAGAHGVVGGAAGLVQV